MDDRLRRLFQQTKDRKAKERQQKKIQRQKEYYQLCKQADQLLKEDRERQKKELMDKLTTLSPKRSQNVRKCSLSISKYSIYHSNLIERETPTDDLYTTREELMEAERRGEGAINWTLWNELVNKK